MKKRLWILLSIISLLLSSCSVSEKRNNEEELKKKIGQMLIVGFRGFYADENNFIVADIKSGRIGGVILFDRDVALGSWDRNIKSPGQTDTLLTTLQNYAKIPLFTAVDQEGGFVARLKQRYGFPKNVSQQYLGELNNEDSTAHYAQITATTLKNTGFNINFAPVVDLNINPESPAIGKWERSFSADPDIVVNHSQIIIDAHKEQNIYCSLKHFPGHGSSTEDSHLGITDVTETWQQIELQPYIDLINLNKADMIMTAHVFNSNLDPDYPATLSKKIMTDLLRDSLNFEGLIVSDDMNMAAITDHYGLKQAIELSLNAGVNIFIFANNLIYDEEISTKVIDIILQLIKENKIDQGHIEKSYEKILDYKSKIQN